MRRAFKIHLFLAFAIIFSPIKWGEDPLFCAQKLSPETSLLPQHETAKAIREYKEKEEGLHSDAYWEGIGTSKLGRFLLASFPLTIRGTLGSLETALKYDPEFKEQWIDGLIALSIEPAIVRFTEKRPYWKNIIPKYLAESRQLLHEVFLLDSRSPEFYKKIKECFVDKKTIENLKHLSFYTEINEAAHQVHDYYEMLDLFFNFLEMQWLSDFDDQIYERFQSLYSELNISQDVERVKRSFLAKLDSAAKDYPQFALKWSALKRNNKFIEIFGQERIGAIESEFVTYFFSKLFDPENYVEKRLVYHWLMVSLISPNDDFKQSLLPKSVFLKLAPLLMVDAWRYGAYKEPWVYAPHEWTKNLAKHLISLLDSDDPLIPDLEAFNQLPDWKVEAVSQKDYPYFDQMLPLIAQLGMMFMKERLVDVSPFLLDIAQKLSFGNPEKQKIYPFLAEYKEDPEVKLFQKLQSRLKTDPDCEEATFFLNLLTSEKSKADFLTDEDYLRMLLALLKRGDPDEEAFQRLSKLWGKPVNQLNELCDLLIQCGPKKYLTEVEDIAGLLAIVRFPKRVEVIKKLDALFGKTHFPGLVAHCFISVEEEPYTALAKLAYPEKENDETKINNFLKKTYSLLNTFNEPILNKIAQGLIAAFHPEPEKADADLFAENFKAILTALYEEKGILKPYQFYFLGSEKAFIKYLSQYPETTLADLKQFSKYFSQFVNADGQTINPIDVLQLFSELKIKNPLRDMVKMLKALGKKTSLLRIIMSAYGLIKHSPQEYDVETFIAYVQEIGFDHGPVLFRAFKVIKQLAAKGEKYANEELGTLGIKGKLGNKGHNAIHQLKTKINHFTAEAFKENGLKRENLSDPLQIDLLRSLVHFDSTHWPNPDRDFNQLLKEFFDDQESGQIEPLPEIFYDTDGDREKKLRIGTMTLHHLPRNFQYLKGAKNKFSEMVVELKEAFEWSRLSDKAFLTQRRKFLSQLVSEALKKLAQKRQSTTDERAKLAFLEKEEKLEQLKERIQNGENPISLLVDLHPKTNTPLAKALRLLLFREGFKKNNTYAQQFREHFSGEPVISNSTITMIAEFVNDIVKNHVLAKMDLDEAQMKKVQHYLNVRALTHELQRADKMKEEETTTITIVPTRGLLAELSGYYCDACWTAKEHIMRNNPNITGFYFVQNFEDPKKRQLVGGSLLIQTRSQGKDTFILRGLNPNDALINKYSSEDIVQGFLEYLETIPLIIGETTRVIGVPENAGARSNRPGVNFALQNIWGEPITLDESNHFNGYDITEACRFLLKVETEQAHIEDLNVKKQVVEQGI